MLIYRWFIRCRGPRQYNEYRPRETRFDRLAKASCAVIAAFDLSERGQALFAEQRINARPSCCWIVMRSCLTAALSYHPFYTPDTTWTVGRFFPCSSRGRRNHRLACSRGRTAARRDQLRYRLDLRPCGVLASARLVDLRTIPLTLPQSYELDCWLVRNDATMRLSYERAGSRPCCALVQPVTGGAQAAPLRGNSATEPLLDPWLTASYGAA